LQLLKLLLYVTSHPLNREGRLDAILRVLRWQVASRLLVGPIGFPFVEDTRLFASRGMTGATGNWYCGLHEVEEMGFVLHALRADDLFMDIGANVGSYTVLAAGATGARTIAVEPIPETFKNLQANVSLNDLSDRTELHCTGISDSRSYLEFTSNLDTVNHVMADKEVAASIRIPVVTMDELLNGAIPAIIKIDVEGHERAVLKGGKKTLSNPGLTAVVMEINGSGARYGFNDDELLGIMHGHGFVPCSYDPIARRMRNWDRSSGNAIFIRDKAAAEVRAAQAKRYRLVNGTI
jgi:FkbM family methyltransferase